MATRTSARALSRGANEFSAQALEVNERTRKIVANKSSGLRHQGGVLH